jgi:PmbA protein
VVEIHDMIEKAGEHCSTFDNVKSWEIFGGSISGSTISIEKGFLKTAETSTQHAINIRLFGEKGKTGSVNITKISLPFIQTSIDKTVSLMKGSLPDPEFKCLVKPAKKYPNIKTPYDSKVKTLTLDDTSDIVDKFMQIRSQDKRIVSVSGDFSYSDIKYTILNSNGVNLHDEESSISLSAEINMEDTIKGRKENSNGYEGQSFNYFKDVQPDEIFNSALEKASLGLKKSKIATDTYPVVLAPQAVVLLFNRTLATAINAQAIYEKRSFLRNQLDRKIASEQLEILDDPWMEDGLATSAWDMEGTPTKPLKLIENGVLQSYLHNVYTANLFESVSTGHGSRAILSSSVGISPSNLRIKPGNESLSSMIESIDKGVLMEASYDRPNFVTGEFSGLIASGYLIENGEIKNALRESLIGFNFFNFYNNISEIGKKLHRRGSHYVPYIKINDVKVSAKD